MKINDCGCGNKAASDKKVAAMPNKVAAPYDVYATAWQNYESYRTFCRDRHLPYLDYQPWLESGDE